jgi:hypothetical protein
MKTKIYSIVLMLTLITFHDVISGQERDVYSDSKMLADLYKSLLVQPRPTKIQLSDERVKSILEYYSGSDSKIPEDIASNNFLIPFFSDDNRKKSRDLEELYEKMLTPVSTRGSRSIGTFDVTTLADGLSKFIVKRTKQELSIAFFENFQKELDKYPDLKSIFPKTSGTLSVMGKEIYLFETFNNSLREAFRNDLNSLPTNLPAIIDNHTDFFNYNQDIKAELLTAFYLAQTIQNNQNPGEIIENFDLKILDSQANARTAFQLLRLISKSLRSRADPSYWIPYSNIKELVNDEVQFKIFLGLVMQNAKNDNITLKSEINPVSLYSVMNNSFNEWSQYQTYYLNIGARTQVLESRIKELNGYAEDSLLFDSYYSIISSSIDLMRYAFQIEEFPAFSGYSLKLEETTKPYLDFSQIAMDIVIDVHRKNYPMAVVNTGYLISSIDNINKDPVVFGIAPKVLKYGSFMAAMVQAKTSDEAEAAIEAVALPTGSARIKRESKFNVSLNAYCGGFLGKNSRSGTNYYSYGITAPVGLATSIGLKHNSFSVFVSIIDLGAVTAFRFKNDTATISNIELRDLISPGGFLSYGIPRSPISINVGWQLSPLLKPVNSSEKSSDTRMGRITIGLCVDLPILNLYTSPKKR